MATRLGALIGRRLQRRRRGFARDERGATMIEFALLALPFFSIVGAILETSVVFLSGQILESAVQDVSRLIRTGQAQGTITTAAQFKSRVCGRLYGLFPDCNNSLHVEVQTVTNFSAASISAPVNWTCDQDACDGWTRTEQYTAGAGSSIMMVQVYFKWPVIMSLGDMTLANLRGNKRLLGASTIFRNEPFT
jgi:Flp pilus assembly protein TadG